MRPLVSGKGFTLLEVLVAISIFTVMYALAYGGLNSILDTNYRIEQENRKWRDLAVFFAKFESDLKNVVNRPVRGEYDRLLPSVSGNRMLSSNEEVNIEFSRMAASAAGFPNSVRRIGYASTEKGLQYLSWPVLDRAPYSEPHPYLITDGNITFRLAYLDEDYKWTDTWDDPSPPRAVRATVILGSGERISRIFSLG